MTHNIKIWTTTAMVAALAACSSGTANVQPSTTRVFAQDAGVAAQALADGETLVAQQGGSAAMNLNYTTGDTGLTNATFEISRNVSGELTFTVNGVTQAFSPGDRIVDPNDGMVYEYQINDSANGVFVNLWNERVTLDEALDTTGTDYAQIWGYQTNQINGGQPDIQGYAAVGTETMASALSTLPTATYNGRARVTSAPTTGWVDWSTSMTRTRGDLAMTADFGAGTIGGQVSNVETRAAGAAAYVPVAGSIAMNQSNIVGNGFAGSLSADAALQASLDIGSSTTGTYSGGFYGPAAEQVAGTMTISGTDGSGANPFNGIGYFIGN